MDMSQMVSNAEEVSMGLSVFMRLIERAWENNLIDDAEKAEIRARYKPLQEKARESALGTMIGIRFIRRGRVCKDLLTAVRDFVRDTDGLESSPKEEALITLERYESRAEKVG